MDNPESYNLQFAKLTQSTLNRMDFVGRMDFKLDLDPETIERELHASEENLWFEDSEG